jgi:hypothetical protein
MEQQIRYPRAISSASLANSRLVPSVASTLGSISPNSQVAEIGVMYGDLTDALLKQSNVRKVLAIDYFDMHDRGGKEGRLKGMSHEAFLRDRFRKAVDTKKLELRNNRLDAIKALEAGAVSAFFIKGCRSYDELLAELYMCDSKLRRGGMIWVADYTMSDYVTGEAYEVVQAVNEFIVQKAYELVYLVLESHMFCTVVLRRTT